MSAAVAAHLLTADRRALVASALTQTALGIEFILSGLNKFADPHYIQNFDQFVRSNPGTQSGILSGLVKGLVDCPNDLYSDHAMRLVGSA